jgi:hypothetical protein
LAITVALLEDIIGHPINRPYLSVVCMPTELQVDAGRKHGCRYPYRISENEREIYAC